jgi:hypothetical protein
MNTTIATTSTVIITITTTTRLHGVTSQKTVILKCYKSLYSTTWTFWNSLLSLSKKEP